MQHGEPYCTSSWFAGRQSAAKILVGSKGVITSSCVDVTRLEGTLTNGCREHPRQALVSKIIVRVFGGPAEVCCHSRPRRGARTRLAIRRAVVPARFAIPREQPHRARRALATQHGAPLAFDGKIRAAEAWAAGPSPPIPCPHAPPARPPLPWQAFRRDPPRHSGQE